MIKHIVMWKLKQDVGGVQAEENAIEMKQRLMALKEKIPEILELEVGINVKQSDAACDIVLLTSFRTHDDLSAYQSHPDHQYVARFVNDVTSRRSVVDYES